MDSAKPLNVFKGPDSLAQYFDPDKNPPLPLVELPDTLNPLRSDGVRIFAKMHTALGAQNVKSLPALKMLLNEPGASTKSIVEASSGSTVLSLGIISRALWGHEDVCAYVTNKKHVDSLKLLRFFGLKIALYGGLAQQEPSDPKGIMNRLRKLAAKDPGVCYPGQYDNDHNWKSHTKWTGAQIWEQLPEINVFCATIGTGGCVTGTGVYLKSKKPSVKIVGVCNVFGDPTPGPRHLSGFESSLFPWRETIDVFETVSSTDSYRMSMHLSRHGLIAGPSSGESLVGLLTYLQRMKSAGLLSSLSDPTTNEISCVFSCADLPYQYMDTYFKKLGPDEFPEIYNQDLLTCDLDAYDERWFLRPPQTAALLPPDPVCPTPSSCRCGRRKQRRIPRRCWWGAGVVADGAAATVVDVRPAAEYTSSHVRGARNISLPRTREDLFGDAKAVQRRWGQLKGAVDGNSWLWRADEDARRGPVLVICGDGDSGKMAAAMLRAKGREAFSVEGGYPELERWLKEG